MPKINTYPTLFEETLQINIMNLKQWKYLNLNQVKSGTLTWSNNGNKTGSITILANTRIKQSYIELDYKYREEPRKYKVKLVSIPSNLGKGLVWYFLCPNTQKKCRKLYSIDGYFLHREAFNGCYYEKQTLSKRSREIEGLFKHTFGLDSVYEEMYSKHFKRYYKGKPTKRYLKLLEQIKQTEKYTVDDIRRLISG